MPGKRLICIRAIFPPPDVAPKLLSLPARIIIGVGLIVPIFLSEPHVKDLVFCRVFDPKVVEHKEIIKNFCDFAIICFQVLIAMAIGGIAVTEQAVRSIQSRLGLLQGTQLAELDKRQRRAIKRAIQIYVDIRYASVGLTPQNAWQRIMKLASDTYTLYTALFRGSGFLFYGRMIGTRLSAAFPGGFYGVVAFILFECLLLSQVLKIYFDYAPACTALPAVT